jgi:membrane protein required for colicin V production
MAVLDYVLIGILLLSVALGVWRGLVKEVLSLATWVAAFWLALSQWTAVAEFFARFVDSPTLRGALAFGCLFLIALVVGALVTRVAAKSLQKSVLDPTNRFLGGLFGAVRGLALAVVLLTLGGFFAIQDSGWYRDSVIARQLSPQVAWMRGHLRDRG